MKYIKLFESEDIYNPDPNKYTYSVIVLTTDKVEPEMDMETYTFYFRNENNFYIWSELKKRCEKENIPSDILSVNIDTLSYDEVEAKIAENEANDQLQNYVFTSVISFNDVEKMFNSNNLLDGVIELFNELGYN